MEASAAERLTPRTPDRGLEVRGSSWGQIYVVVNFLFQVIFVFLLFWGMVIYANEVETKEK